MGSRTQDTGIKIHRVVTRHPLMAMCALSIVVLGLEVAQFVPEVLPGAHVLSVFSRAIIYSLIAALIFNWFLIEIPQRRRKRAVYEFNRLSFETLLTVGPASLLTYSKVSPPLSEEFDPWNKEVIRRRTQLVAQQNPVFFGNNRRLLLETSILGVQLALDTLRAAQHFLDEDVAHALALFPAANGLNQLQVGCQPDGSVSVERDLHITMELTLAARRLYSALLKDAPEIPFSFGAIKLSNGQEASVPKSYLIRS